MLPVFSCDLHGECTERKTLARPRIHSCLSCANKNLPPPIRVGILTPFLCFGGGVEQWLHSLISYMRDDVAFEIGILVDAGHYYEWDKAGIDYLLPLAPVSIGSEACRSVADRCDILLTWGVDGLDRWYRERPDKPIAFVLHGDGPWSAHLVTGARRWADRIVAVGDAPLSICPEATMIANGVDLTRCERDLAERTRLRRVLGIPQDAIVVGQIGRMVGEKDPAAVGRAVGELGPAAWGLLVGNGPQEIVDRARRAAGGRLVHLPAQQDISGPLSAMDAFLFSSHSEGFGLALVEAWAAGVPTVSTVVGVAMRHRDLVTAVPINADGASLASAVQAAISPAGRRIVRRARTVASQEYSAERMAAEWRGLLRSIAIGSKRPYERRDPADTRPPEEDIQGRDGDSVAVPAAGCDDNRQQINRGESDDSDDSHGGVA